MRGWGGRGGWSLEGSEETSAILCLRCCTADQSEQVGKCRGVPGWSRHCRSS